MADPSDGVDLAHVNERLGALVDEFEQLPDARVRRRVRELVGYLLDVHGAGLSRIVEMVDQEEARGTMGRMLADELVASLLLLHGLHPIPAEERVRQAVAGARGRLDDSVSVSVTVGGHGTMVVTVRAPSGGAVEQARATVMRALDRMAPDAEVDVQVEVQVAAPAVRGR